jgi:hypothetical protein
MQGILYDTGLLLLVLCLAAFWMFCINVRILRPLAIVVGNHYYLCGPPSAIRSESGLHWFSEKQGKFSSRMGAT